MTTLWPRCPCGHTGWRYLNAEGSGWRCWCGNHKPDRPAFEEALEVQLPLFEVDA